MAPTAVKTTKSKKGKKSKERSDPSLDLEIKKMGSQKGPNKSASKLDDRSSASPTKMSRGSIESSPGRPPAIQAKKTIVM